MVIIHIDRKIFSNAIKKYLAKNFCSQNSFLDFETKEILHSESPFHQACSKFCGEKALSNYFKAQNLYLEPVEKVVGFDHEKGKAYSVQYISIPSTLKALLQHEDVLGHVYEAPSIEADTMTTYSQGLFYRKNKLLSNVPNCLQIILYHNYFGLSNPLGNKIKYKTSAFYFVLGNIPGKYRARPEDVQLALLFSSALIQKYGYDILIQPLIDNIKVLESTGLKVDFEGKIHNFKGTVTMVAPDNLAAHALGGFSVISVLFKSFVAFAMLQNRG